MLKKKLGSEAIERDWIWNWNRNLKDYFKISSTLIIPEGCEKVGAEAFEGCRELEKVVIPKGCERIGQMAFVDCKRLREVIIPECVKVIKKAAFCGCINATIILKRLEKNFGEIDDIAFFGCKNVKEEVRA